MKFEINSGYKCTYSASPGYRVGVVYYAFPDPDNPKIPMLAGSDGYNDRCSMLQSKFVVVETKAITSDKDKTSKLRIV